MILYVVYCVQAIRFIKIQTFCFLPLLTVGTKSNRLAERVSLLCFLNLSVTLLVMQMCKKTPCEAWNMQNTVLLFSHTDCQLSSAHHLCEGGLYDSHHQALQADNLLHVKAHCGVADSICVFWFLRGSLLCLCLVRATVLGQADGRNTGGVLQQVADFP